METFTQDVDVEATDHTTDTAIAGITDEVRRMIPREEQWPYNDQERCMMQDIGYIFE